MHLKFHFYNRIISEKIDPLNLYRTSKELKKIIVREMLNPPITQNNSEAEMVKAYRDVCIYSYYSNFK